MTKEQKIEELKKYIDTLKEYTHLKKRYDALIAKGDGIKAQVITSMPIVHSGKDMMVANVCEIQGLGELIQKRIDKLYSTLLKIESSIQNVEDSKYRMLLSLKYIDGCKWEEIAVEMEYYMRHVHRIHDEAIEAIEIVDISYKIAQ